VYQIDATAAPNASPEAAAIAAAHRILVHYTNSSRHRYRCYKIMSAFCRNQWPEFIS
jgi:hypothetical protein